MPFDPLVPNADTIEAMKAARARTGSKSYTNAKAMLADRGDEDD